MTTINQKLRTVVMLATGTLSLAGAFAPLPARAQWATTYEQFYLPGSFNWQFRGNYPAADRLFNAFDYGHAILYEKLWTMPGAPVSILEQDEFNFVTRKLLVSPPSLPLEEGAIEVQYAKIAPEAKIMFEWAHLLHRQIYDVLADERLAEAEKDAQVQALIRYYKTRKDLAFSSVPKSMDLMEGQPYSLAFRQKYPKFNGLIWAYHWLQVGLYEPLLAGRNADERQTGVLATVARFRQMIEQPPTWMPRVMPMTPAVAPLFTARYPEAAIIFDNLHSMHDVISDVLANPAVRRDQKRAEILKAGRRYRDDTSYVMTMKEWRDMATMMGIENMGGPVRGFLAAFPAATVERGARMTHSGMAGMEGMAGMQHGAPAESGAKSTMSGMDHSQMSKPSDSSKAMDHSSMSGMDHSSMPGMTMGTGAAKSGPGGGMNHTHSADMSALHNRMMADPVIRARLNADPEMRRLMVRAMGGPSASSNAHSHAPAAAPKRAVTRKKTAAKPTVTRKAAPTKKPASPTAAKAKPKPAVDPMAGMDHSKMKMPPKK